MDSRDGSSVQIDTKQDVISAVTEKYVMLSVNKVWGDIRRRAGLYGTDDFQGGISATPPFSMELVVAFTRPGKEDVKEDLPKNAITKEELLQIMQQYLELVDEIQKTVNKK